MNKKRLSILEAVDHLSDLAELNHDSSAETNETKIKETFQTLNDYLKHLYHKERSQLKSPQTRRGLQALMQLAGEAMEKVGKYTEIFKETLSKEGVIPEYQQLQQFYLSKIVTPKEQKQEKTEPEEELEELDLERQALKDLDSVRTDHDYELFYVRKEDGMPFFHHNLLRHLRLVGNFDETLIPSETENPFLKMKIILDRDFHTAAKEILREGATLFEEFYKEGMKFKGMIFIACLNKAIMALMLAANPRNLFHNTTGKHCLDYFVDFQVYLRQALRSEDYHRFSTSSPEKIEPFFLFVLKLQNQIFQEF